MKLHNYAILKESLRSAREKYLNTNEISQPYFDELVEMDFTKTKKYVEWLCKVFVTDTRAFDGDGIDRLIELLHKFDKVVKTKYKLPSKDINTYKTIDELYAALKDFDAYLDNRRMAKKHKGAEKIYENDKCYIYYIKTKEACMLYGSNTKWCITSKDEPHWENYSDKYIFFFIIDKQIPKVKYAIAISLLDDFAMQTFDPEDRKVSTEPILRTYSIPLLTLKNLINKFIAVTKESYLNILIKNNVITPTKLKGETYYNINSIIPSIVSLVENRKFKVKFNKCNTDFNCSNIPLDSLEGAPREVKGNFSCQNCELKSLKGAPEIVEGTFVCKYNPLTSLTGGPKKVLHNYYCSHTNITNLIGSPIEWGTPTTPFIIIAQNCPKLASLEGAPYKIFGKCNFSFNISLKTLEGGPKIVFGAYIVSHCLELTSLKGAPEFIGPTAKFSRGIFNCSETRIKDLKGLPDTPGCKYALDISGLKLDSLDNLPINVTNPIKSIGKMEVLAYTTSIKNVPFPMFLDSHPELKDLYMFRYLSP